MGNPFESPSIISIGPGILGLERGLQRAIGKIKTVTYVEVESFILANLLAGMETGMVDEAPLWIDVKTFAKIAKHFRGKICGILAGYSCQPFSLAGKRKGAEDPRHIYPYISSVIRATGPVFCFFENVSGHLSLGYDVVYKDLRAMGYAVESGIFTAEEVGAPHERERLFILAISERFLSYTRRKRVRWETWTNINWSSTGAELDNARSIGHEPQHAIPAGGHGTELTGEAMADTNDHDHERCGNGDEGRRNEFANQCTETMVNAKSSIRGLPICEPGQGRQPQSNSINTNGTSETKLENTNDRRCQQCDPGIRTLWGTGIGREKLADTDDTRCGKFGGPKPVPTEQPSIECNSAFNGKRTTNQYDRWPAGPGQQQQEWEEPRTIESRVGFSIDGYNFREDLLRAAGNSVVEQCAEIAFIELLKKHRNNHEIK